MPLTRDHVVIDGIKTFFLKAGEGEVPVVLLHGSSPGACSEVNWSRNLESVASHGFTVYAFDQPGFGRTESPTDFSVEFRVAHAKVFLEAIGLKKCAVVGNSMGGYIAARLAIESRLVQRLVLVSPVPVLPAELGPNRDAGAHSARLQAYEPSIENMKALTSGTIFNNSKITNELIELRHQMSIGANYVAQKHRGSATARSPVDIGAAGLDMKVLIVWGAQDSSVPAEWALPLCRALPESRLHIFSSCGHWPQWEYPDEFNRLLIDFLRV